MNNITERDQIGGRVQILSGFPFSSSRFSTSQGIPLIRIRDLGSPNTQVRFDGSYDKRYLIVNGEILVGMDGDFNAVRWSGEPALLNQRVCKIVSTDDSLDQGFLFHSLQTNLDVIHQRTAQTTVRHLSTKDIERIKLPCIPLPGQQMIASILDTADAVIHSAERLIAKLKQVRQGLLHDLLTHAAANVAKPTLLGDVSVISGGVTLGRAISGSGTIELPYLRVANVQDGYIDTSDLKLVRVLRTEVARYRLRAGDVLMTEGGDFDKLGRGAVWDGTVDPCLHQNHIFRVRCDTSLLLPEYLAIYSASPAGKRHFVMLSKQTTNLASINMTQLKAFPILIPPLREQLHIVSAVQAQDDCIQQEKADLAKLRPLKQGLMGDLLTGRVRVGVPA
jgi:type I restriction enzyme, S subunit